MDKGIVKNYLRYVLDKSFGGIAGNRSNVVFVPARGYVLCACCEQANVFDYRTGEQRLSLRPWPKAQITNIAFFGHEHIRVVLAYSDGVIYICSLDDSYEEPIKLLGHRLAVECLVLCTKQILLASAGRDKDIVIWDLAQESGLCKFRGHKDVVTQLQFFDNDSLLISSSKDRTIRFWDVDLQHCVQTLTPSSEEILAFAAVSDGALLVGETSRLRVFTLSRKEEQVEQPEIIKNLSELVVSDALTRYFVDEIGTVDTSSSHRVTEIRVQGRVIAVNSGDRNIDLLKYLTADELKKKLKQRNSDSDYVVNAKDLIVNVRTHKADAKVQSICLAKEMNGQDLLIWATKSNSIEVNSCNDSEVACLTKIVGHRTSKCVALSDDGSMIAMNDDTRLRIWNRALGQNFRTIDCEHTITSLAFMPNNHFVVVGSKEGSLFTIDLVSKSISYCFDDAHEDSVTGIAVLANKIGFATSSSDGTIKLWDFQSGTEQPFIEQRQESVGDSCLTIALSHNRELIACAVVDCTIKVLFTDSFKLFLLLYGHSAPVQSMDISFDDDLLISGSADRTIRIWGLRFGDCHRSLLYHENSITSVKFVPETHHFFAGSQDDRISRWDADSFERIQTLADGHFSSVTDIAVTDSLLASVSLDRTVRTWRKSDEILVPKVERETERELALDTEERRSKDNIDMLTPGQPLGESGAVLVRTADSLDWGDWIVDAIDMAEKLQMQGDNESFTDQLSQIMQMLRKVKPSDLYSVLMHINFNRLPVLFDSVERSLTVGQNIELCAKTVAFLSRLHMGQLITSEETKEQVKRLSKLLQEKMTETMDMLAFNGSALTLLTKDRKFYLRKDAKKKRKFPAETA